MNDESDSIDYLSKEDILAIHELIVESNEDTEAGVSSPGDVDYTVDSIQQGHFGQTPESIHEKAYQILRLLAANHPFVDGNKRTALMSVRIFYALNQLDFEYDRSIKDVLKELATDEATVEKDSVIDYLQKNTEPLALEYVATINLWMSRIEESEQLPSSLEPDNNEPPDHEPNDYADSTRRGE